MVAQKNGEVDVRQLKICVSCPIRVSMGIVRCRAIVWHFVDAIGLSLIFIFGKTNKEVAGMEFLFEDYFDLGWCSFA